MRARTRALIVWLVSAGSVAAAGAAGVQTTATPPVTPQSDAYTYQTDGRRDPFVNLLNSGVEVRSTAKRSEGVGGLALGEVSVRGVMQSRGGMVAMIQGPDNKTYIVHQGDRLLDATIKTINQQGLIVTQEVTDPLSVVKQREVRKMLRSLEGGKE